MVTNLRKNNKESCIFGMASRPISLTFFLRFFGKIEMAPVTAVVIGAGMRGKDYSGYSLDFPEKLKVLYLYGRLG